MSGVKDVHFLGGTVSGSGVMSWSGWSGAEYSTRRGQVEIPTLDTSRLTTGYVRRELMKKALWCFGNTGIGRRCTKGVSGLVGYQIPRPCTSDADFNAAVMDLFKRRMMSTKAFDVAGKWNWLTMQINANAARLRDGDFLIVLSETTTGQARFAFYEGGQIKSPPGKTEKEGWNDGVKVDGMGRHVAYGIAEYGKNDVKVIPAQSCIFFADFERRGQTRGISVLQHAVNNILDTVEVRSDLKTALKVAALFGIYEKEGETKSWGSALGGGFEASGGADPCAVDGSGGSESKANIQQNVERVVGGPFIGKVSKGGEIGVVHDDRPGPNQKTFWDEIIRDISWGVGLPPSVLWDISTLTGPAVRYSLNESENWCKFERGMLRAVMYVMYVYFIAKEIKVGNLAMPQDAEWWRVEWMGQARLSIDAGRDGQLRITQLKAGMTTISDWAAESSGAGWRETITQCAEERAWMVEESARLNLAPGDVFPEFFKGSGGVDRETGGEAADGASK